MLLMANEQQSHGMPEEIEERIDRIVEAGVQEAMPRLRRRTVIDASIASVAVDAGIETADLTSAARTHEAPLIAHSPLMQLAFLALPWAIMFGLRIRANRLEEHRMRENAWRYVERLYQERNQLQ